MKRRTKLDIDFLKTRDNRVLLGVNIVLLIFYFVVISTWFEIGSPLLFSLLLLSQVFYLWQGLTHLSTVWNTNHIHTSHKKTRGADLSVDIFITVAGEPLEIIRETVLAAKRIKYKKFSIFILNDGRVAGKDNWREVIALAKELGVNCITRTTPGGAKAGNINHGLKLTSAPFVAILDADHVPKPSFLKRMMRHATDPSVGFIQSPQYYKNASVNSVAQGSWEQQQFFFGAICKGKNRSGVVTMCGTNMIVRREALEIVGGMCDSNIAEDFITGMFIHEKGYTSVYVAEILALGLAPEDYLSYFKQQLRWARGSLEVLFRYNPFGRKGLNLVQKMQYTASASFYLSGFFVSINALLPLIFLFTGLVPLTNPTMSLVIVFMPYMIITLISLQVTSNQTYTLKALAFSMGSFWIYNLALFQMLLNKKSGFAITSKTRLNGSFVYLVIPHLLYIGLTTLGTIYALATKGVSTSLITNVSWAIFFIVVFWPSLEAAGVLKSLQTFMAPKRAWVLLKDKYVRT